MDLGPCPEPRSSATLERCSRPAVVGQVVRASCRRRCFCSRWRSPPSPRARSRCSPRTAPGPPSGCWCWSPLVGCVYTAAGILAWIRRPANRMGPLLCIGGLVWLAASAVNIAIPAFIAVGSDHPDAADRARGARAAGLPVGAAADHGVPRADDRGLRGHLGAASTAVPVRRRVVGPGRPARGRPPRPRRAREPSPRRRRLRDPGRDRRAADPTAGHQRPAAPAGPAAGVRMRRRGLGGDDVQRDPRPGTRDRSAHPRHVPALPQHGAARRLRHRAPDRRLRTHQRARPARRMARRTG